MNKKDLIAKLAKATYSTQPEAEKHLNAFMDIVRDELLTGNTITLTGFCKFKTMIRREHTARNPSTGEKVIVPTKTSAVCKMSKTLFNIK